MNDRMDNSGDAELRRLLLAADSVSRVQNDTCPDEMTLAGYLDGRMPAGQVEAIESHLASCSACRRAVVELRQLLAEPAVIMPPADFAARVAGVLPPAASRAGLWRRTVRWSAVAAAVLIVAWGGFTAGRKTYRDRRLADVAVARHVTFDLDAGEEQIAASVHAFDEMLLAGGEEQ